MEQRPKSKIAEAYDPLEQVPNTVHIGIHTRWDILEGKLEQRDEPRRTTATWQLTRLPEKLSKEGPNYLFVAVDGI